MHADRLVKRRRSRRHQPLEEREPALITLPVPLPPSIPIIGPILTPILDPILTPILNPILTPLIAGIPVTTVASAPPAPTSPVHTLVPSTPATQPQSQPQPQPAPTTAPSTPPSSQPGGGSSEQPPPSNNGSGSGGGGGDGSGNNDNNQGGTDSGNGQGGSNPGSGNAGGSQPSEVSSAGGHSEVPPDSPSQTTPGSGGSNTSTTSLSPVIGDATGNGGNTFLAGAIPTSTYKPAVNFGDDPGTSTLGESVPSVTFSAIGSLGTGNSGGDTHQAGSGSNSPSSSGNGPDDGGSTNGSGPGSQNATHHGLSKPVIAVIAVIGALMLLALLVCAFRRCAAAKRTAYRRRWFRGSIYGVPPVSSSGYFKQHPASARSSFATNFEHDPFVAPSPPPIPTPLPLSSDWPLYQPAEMAQTNPAIITLPPAAPTTASTPSPPIRLFRRDSYDSVTTGHTLTTEGIPSNLSLPQIITLSEHHVVSSEHLGLIPATPLSVRPFSPSERWSFPKPPNGARPDSELYPMMYSVSPDSFSSSEYITAPESEDPFSDFAVAESVDAHTVETFITVDTDAASHFSPVEIVCRPFVPSRDDEVAMNPGDEIRVLKRFDDGWAYAENCVTRKHGLFPIDCLRMANQDLPAFLAAKRISHYAAVTPQSRAVPRMTTVEEDHSA